ncbi:MAG TPA: tetratricopeptide repeat protein, partial [Saprospiraceae bacterium]|nr:tetratricopeptide repeat protein [Saprospiraceae bacterium]
MAKKSNYKTHIASTPIVNQKVGVFEKYHLHLVLLVTLLCFINTLGHQFVAWDDHVNIYENDLVSTFSFDNFLHNTIEIFKTNLVGNYNPLSLFSLAIDSLIFGIDNPWGFHLVNVILHIICVFFVYKIVLSLDLNWRVAFVTALLFGIQPMRVESVAWATERKDVLFGAFYLWALWLYILQKSGKSSKNRSLLIVILFTLSLFSKIQAVMLPMSMIAVDYYFTGTITLKDFMSKWYYFLLSLIFGIIGILFLREAGTLTIGSEEEFPFYIRLFIGSFSFLVYLVKSIIPYEMSSLYPYRAQIPWYMFASMLITIPYLWALYSAYKADKRLIVFGLLFFFFNVVMMLQILGAGQGFLADRFTYIPYLGLFIIYANYIQKIWNAHVAVNAFIVGLFMVYGFVTIRQNMVWKNSETLWSNVLKVNNDLELAYFNRANYRRDNENIQGAIQDYTKVIAIKPDDMAYNSVAKLYNDNFSELDSLKVALNFSNKAIEMEKQAGYLANRGIIKFKLGMIDQAIADVNEAIKIAPEDPSAYYNKFIIYNKIGRANEIASDLEKYLELDGKDANLWFEASRLNYANGDFDKALPLINKAITMNNRTPNY